MNSASSTVSSFDAIQHYNNDAQALLAPSEKILSSDIAAHKPFSDYAEPPQDFNSGVLYFVHKFSTTPLSI
jgi:hypothetical protein